MCSKLNSLDTLLIGKGTICHVIDKKRKFMATITCLKKTIGCQMAQWFVSVREFAPTRVGSYSL